MSNVPTPLLLGKTDSLSRIPSRLGKAQASLALRSLLQNLFPSYAYDTSPFSSG